MLLESNTQANSSVSQASSFTPQPSLQDKIYALLQPYLLTPWRKKLSVPGVPCTVMEAMVRIPPEAAWAILDGHNPTNNRNLNPRKIQKLRATMRAGKWNPHLPDSGGAFGKDGWLKNFQHRLSAAMMEGLPLTTRVEIGHENNVLEYLDRTEPRTEAQQAKILGRNAGTEHHDYAAVKMMWEILDQSTYWPFGSDVIFDHLDNRYPRAIWKIVPANAGNVFFVSAIRGALLLLARKWPDQMREFVRQIADNELKKNTGPWHLHNYMTSKKSTFQHEKQTYEGKMTMVRRTFKAFHLFLTGETSTKLIDSIDSIRALFKEMDPTWEFNPNGSLRRQPKKKKDASRSSHDDEDDG